MGNKNKIRVKTNLETATPEQKERLMQNVVEAYQYLYRSVLERKINEVLNGCKH
jgi:hypothetical protein